MTIGGVLLGIDILKKLLHQRIVVVGQLLQHLVTGLCNIVVHVTGNVRRFRYRAGPVGKGPKTGKIDIAGHRLAVDNGQLPQHEGLFRNLLQSGHQVADRTRGPIHLVDENEMRQAHVAEPTQHGHHHDRLVRLRLAYDNGRVGTYERVGTILPEFDGARTIEKREDIVQVSGRRDVELRAHLPVACLGARVTDGVAFLRAPLSVNCSRGEQDRLEKCCFSRGVWTDKRYGSRPGISTPAHRSCLDAAAPTPLEIPSRIQRPERHDVLP